MIWILPEWYIYTFFAIYTNKDTVLLHPLQASPFLFHPALDRLQGMHHSTIDTAI